MRWVKLRSVPAESLLQNVDLEHGLRRPDLICLLFLLRHVPLVLLVPLLLLLQLLRLLDKSEPENLMDPREDYLCYGLHTQTQIISNIV